ncbi:hypothetical protein [Sellimonas intestinalis]|uniref:hypothetical protein n=1 Tax=Sellimonas intestinalis TaxID=1653434 RepID=UPI003AB3C006
MKIPEFLNRDDYLQNPIMRRFLKEHKIDFVENRADYIKAIEEYAAQSDEAERETREWLLKVVKEGSKEICYRKIHGIGEWHRDPVLVEAKIKEIYPNCPMRNILSYRNTGERTLIEYKIITNEEDEVSKIEFTFSKLFLYGEAGKMGDVTIFPVFVEVYLDEGFVISRGKAKSTLYQYDENNHMLFGDYKVDTMDYAMSAVNKIIDMFEFEAETNPKRLKNENSQMLYRIYEKYSFTPADVVEKVESQDDVVHGFVDQIFSNLQLDVRNKGKALLDAKIFVEKFISINGNNEDIFKEDRPAYLIKVSADDEIELTKIDTTSDKKVPLQCTEAFFDSKKSVVKSKKCKRLNLIFKRTDETYFSKNNPLVVQLGTHKNYGYVKTMQYAEEADIQNVLQAIFDNY